MSTLEREMERMGWAKPPDQQLLRSINRRQLEEDRRTADAREAAKEAHREAMAAMRAAIARQSETPPAIQPKKSWVAYGVGASLAILLGAVVAVMMARTSLRSTTLQDERQSNATLVCIDGDGIAADDENFWTWLTGGHSFQCKSWETLDAKRDRERAELNERAMAKEKMARRAAGFAMD